MDTQAPKIDNGHIDIVKFILEVFFKYGLIIMTAVFSIIAKIHSMMRYKKKMTRIECIMETVLCGVGSSIAIYVLHSMNLQTWLFCTLGGFSSLVITPITTTISKEALPILELIVKYVKKYIDNWFKKQKK